MHPVAVLNFAVSRKGQRARALPPRRRMRHEWLATKLRELATPVGLNLACLHAEWLQRCVGTKLAGAVKIPGGGEGRGMQRAGTKALWGVDTT